ncbi:MAG: GntR family transcriptional regulator [Dactylosporangium sp.]|nr:GntR family transcriptional regulator [Dactylosporangium sp.]NNJ61113.1 GntR family transcriptional regulator [Dactylosporangium sp.]
MPIEFTPPKYAVIVNTVQERIENGIYPPGSTLPSETILMKEFGVSRPTTVRALDLLRQEGWIAAHQGRGRTVIGSPETRGRRAPAYAQDTLAVVETGTVTVASAGPVLAPPRAAAALGLDPGTPVIARCRIVCHEEIGPTELSAVYLPVELAAGTDMSNPMPLTEGVLRHLTRLRGIDFDHATERISARTPSAEEARLLDVGRRDCLLTVLFTIYDRAARPVLAIDTALPVARKELEDGFAIT